MHNKTLFTIYMALQELANKYTLPFDVSYAIARNLKIMEPWLKQYMDSRLAAVQAAGGKPVQYNAMLIDDYNKLSPDVRSAFDKAITDIENETAAPPDFYKLPTAKLTERPDGRVIELPAALLMPLVDTIIV